MATNDLLIRISGDTKGFSAAMKTVNAELVSSQKAVEKTATGFAGMSGVMSRLGPLTAGIFSAGALLEFGKSAVLARAAFDSLERGLTAVMGSASKASMEMVRLKEVAKLPGLGFQEAVKGSINLQAAGFSADVARRALQGFGNALATVGKGKTDLDGVITALTQIAAKGKVSAEEINQLAERVPQIREVMRSAFGTANTEDLQKLGISSQEFIEKVISELEKLPKATGGLQNDLENFSDNWAQLMNQVGKVVQPAVSVALEWLGKLSKGITDSLSNWDELMATFDEMERRTNQFAGISKRQSLLGMGDFQGGSLDDAKAYLDMVRQIDEKQKTLGTSYQKNQMLVLDLKNHTSRLVDVHERQAKAVKVSAEAHKELTQAMHGPMTLGDAFAAEMAKLKDAEYDAYFREVAKSMYEIANGAKTASLETTRYNRILEMMRPVDSGPVGLTENQLDAIAAEQNIRRAKEGLKDLGIQYGSVLNDAKESWRGQSKVMQEVSTIVTDLSRGIAQVIVEGGKMGDVFKRIAKEIAQAIIREIIQGALVKLGKAIADSIGALGGLGKALGGLFGGATSAGASAVGSVAGSAGGGAAGAVGSAVGAGITGIVGAVAGVVGAVSSVIGNFQFMAMNKSLDLIEHETRYSQIHLLNILEKLNAHLPGIDDLNKRLNEAAVTGWKVWTDGAMQGAFAGGGGYQTTINFSGAWIGYRDVDTFVDDLVRRIKSKL